MLISHEFCLWEFASWMQFVCNSQISIHSDFMVMWRQACVQKVDYVVWSSSSTPTNTEQHRWLAFALQSSNHTAACSFCHPLNAGLLHSFSFVSEVCVEVLLPKQSAKVLSSIFRFKKEVMSLIELGCDQSALLRHDLSCCWMRN